MANEQHVMRQDGKEAFCTAVLLGGGGGGGLLWGLKVTDLIMDCQSTWSRKKKSGIHVTMVTK